MGLMNRLTEALGKRRLPILQGRGATARRHAAGNLDAVFEEPNAKSVCDFVDSFVASTRVAVFVREADNLLMIRPDKTMSLNASAAKILTALYARDAAPARVVLARLAGEMRVTPERLIRDTHELVQALGAILNEDFSPRPKLAFTTFDRKAIQYPTLAEIALTYGCNNKCVFCYAASPYRVDEQRTMTTDEVKVVMRRIFEEAHVPSLSFTGGEATLRPDLPELIRFGKELGFRVNLISNGLRLGSKPYADKLAEAGLDSAQISIEAATAEIHDAIVDRPGAFAKTVRAVHNLKGLGVHVHTNSTLCGPNLAVAHDLIRYVARDLGLKTMSMNMLIRTGVAVGSPDLYVSYGDIGEMLPGLIDTASEEKVKLVWYSPIPYCIFNPVLHDLGAKSCACIDGILSVSPAGEVLPCSSFADGIGSLLERPYAEIYESPAAQYWRNKEYVPPSCIGCPEQDICGGACPLYWDAAGSFAELPSPAARDCKLREQWERSRQRGQSYGVQAPD
jgi:radical SAM protein with 4Fe4S-binding SPASM domain